MVYWYSVHACSVTSVVSDSLRSHGLQPARLLCPWDSPGILKWLPHSPPGDLPRDQPTSPVSNALKTNPGMWSQVSLRKHHYKQSWWRWWNSSWAISNPQRWCCESTALNMPANLENLAVATGLEKVSFHSNPKERQCQRVLKLPHNCTHLTL